MQLAFQLVKAASKAGGDRYEAKTASGEDFVVYFPQSISRPNGAPLPALLVVVSPV